MSEPWESITHWALVAGLVLFCWSVSCSMEQIAKALTRLAEAEETRRRNASPTEPPSKAD